MAVTAIKLKILEKNQVVSLNALLVSESKMSIVHVKVSRNRRKSSERFNLFTCEGSRSLYEELRVSDTPRGVRQTRLE